MVKILLVQPRPAARFDDPDNLRRALILLDRCRAQLPGDVICFPEYFPFAGDEELAGAARRLGVYIVGGLVETDGGRRYNTATLFDRRGRLVGRQRKQVVGRLEVRGFGITPGSGWTAFDTDIGRLGLPVCIDFWGQPEAARQLAAQDVDLIINPCIFPILRGHWQTGARARAFDHYVPVAGVNTAGFTAEIAGRRYPMQGGGSFVIAPPVFRNEQDLAATVRTWDRLDGWLRREAGGGEEIVTATLDLTGLGHWRRAIRKRFGMTPPGESATDAWGP